MVDTARGLITLATQDGETYDEFESISITESFIDPLGSYRLSVLPARDRVANALLKLDRGELIVLKVNGNPLATPLIVTRDTTIGKRVAIDITARSVLCTPYEGSSNPDMAKKWQSDIAVDSALLDQLALYGFSEIYCDAASHVNALTGVPVGGTKAPINLKALTLKELQGQEGEAAYALCARVFTRLGCALHVDWNGLLLLCRPDYDQEDSYALVQDGDATMPGDRMLADPGITVHESNEGLFSEVVVRGNSPDDPDVQVTALPVTRIGASDTDRPFDAPYGKVKLTPVANAKHVYKSTTAPYKPRIVLDKEARDAQRCLYTARNVYSAGAKDAFTIECTVSGFVAASGRVWAPNTIASVHIGAIDFDERMWVLERSFEQTRAKQTTKLKLIPLGSLTLGDQ